MARCERYKVIYGRFKSASFPPTMTTSFTSNAPLLSEPVMTDSKPDFVYALAAVRAGKLPSESKKQS